jgi:hypothetical protein
MVFLSTKSAIKASVLPVARHTAPNNRHWMPPIVKLLLLERPESTALHRLKACGGVLLTYSHFILKPKIRLI